MHPFYNYGNRFANNGEREKEREVPHFQRVPYYPHYEPAVRHPNPVMEMRPNALKQEAMRRIDAALGLIKLKRCTKHFFG